MKRIVIAIAILILAIGVGPGMADIDIPPGCCCNVINEAGGVSPACGDQAVNCTITIVVMCNCTA